MSRELEMLGFLAVLWLLGVAGGATAWRWNGRRRTPRLWLALALGGAAVAIGVVGVWTPFSFWPQIFYPVSLGGVQFSLDFRWLFSVPLAVGVLGLARTVVRRRGGGAISGDSGAERSGRLESVPLSSEAAVEPATKS